MRIFRPFENAFPPFQADDDPIPPKALGAFLHWALWECRWIVLLFAIATIGFGFLDVWAAWYLGALVDMAAESGREKFLSDNFWPLIGAALIFGLARPVAYALQSAVMSLAIAPNLGLRVLWRLHRHTLGQSLSFFQDDFAGRLASKQMQTHAAVIEAMLDTIGSIGLLMAYVIGMGAVLAAVDWRLALAMGVWVAVYVWWVAYCLPRIRIASKNRAESRAAVNGRLVDSFTNMTTVKLFAHAGREEEFARQGIENLRETSLEFGRIAVTMRLGLAFLNAFGALLVVGLAVWLWQIGSATIGDLGAAAALILRATQMSGWVAWSALGVFSNIGIVEDGAATLSVPHGIIDKPDAVPLTRAAGAIRYDDVTFEYGRDTGGVRGLDLTIEPGSRVGLVGRSGAGKSTLVNLLLRLYDVEKGSISVDGHDIRALTQESLRRQIAMVTQDTAMFNRSARDNILYGAKEGGDALEAARIARADAFIKDLRDREGREGFDAHIGERGVKLSGGQRQRIAIARAVLKDAPILILDEATSALDSEVEAEIQEELSALMRDKTVIAIAHRLSTIAHLDRIIVLDAGRIVEDGTHDALIAKGGQYAGFWSRQSGGFLDLE
jgi:ATP-binding cassette subfamily B protein